MCIEDEINQHRREPSWFERGAGWRGLPRQHFHCFLHPLSKRYIYIVMVYSSWSGFMAWPATNTNRLCSTGPVEVKQMRLIKAQARAVLAEIKKQGWTSIVAVCPSFWLAQDWQKIFQYRGVALRTLPWCGKPRKFWNCEPITRSKWNYWINLWTSNVITCCGRGCARGKIPGLRCFNHNLGVHGIDMCHDIPHVYLWAGDGQRRLEKSLSPNALMIDVFLAESLINAWLSFWPLAGAESISWQDRVAEVETVQLGFMIMDCHLNNLDSNQKLWCANTSTYSWAFDCPLVRLASGIGTGNSSVRHASQVGHILGSDASLHLTKGHENLFTK